MQKRSAAMVDAILEAAARILEEGGVGALGTNAIAQRAGVSIGSLYQYFPSKESILAELIRRDHAHLLEELTRVADVVKGRPLAEAIIAMVDVGVAHQLDRPDLARTLDYAEPMLPLDRETAAIDQAINCVVLALLRSSALRLRGKALETAADDIAALSRGMIDAAGRRGETDRAALAKRVARAIMGYLAPSG